MLADALWRAATALALLTNVACVCGGVLGAVMVAQFLEYGALSAARRHKLRPRASVDELRTLFYRVYWAFNVAYVGAAALWVALTERSDAKLLYGVAFLLALQLGQLALALALSSWEDVLAGGCALAGSSSRWLRALRARVKRLSGGA
ncbi:hypothetical protein PybrP1_001082 [[Pythium] brassicae (nom. inval.)]|nr:hypothetical protein PybrP1_001082 [[Pythium] brassicae (nom. inval.)]